MAEPEQYVLIIQPDDFQRHIWHTVLQSQGLTVYADASTRSPLPTLASYSAQGQEFDLVLVPWPLVEENWLGWLALCERQTPPLKTVLLLPQTISPEDRREAAEVGAMEVVDWIDEKNPTTSVIAGTRRILQQLTRTTLDKEALVGSLVQTKRFVEDSERSPEANEDYPFPPTPPPPSPPVEDTAEAGESEEDGTPQETSEGPENRRSDGRRRRYRGRTY